MEALHNKLQPYKKLVATAASILTIAQFFSGIVICKDIYDKKTTKGISSIPFVGAVLIGILVLKYALILDDNAMLTVNIGAIILNTSYVAVYLCYSEDIWNEVCLPFLYGAAIVAVVLGYSHIESPEKLEYRYGLILMVLQILLLASPLGNLTRIISSRDASSIPLPLTLMAAIVTFLWFIYSIILNNVFMMGATPVQKSKENATASLPSTDVQNSISFVLCVIQLGLVFMYGSQRD